MTLIDLLYLNALVPVTLSFQQIFLITLEVIIISNQKGINILTILDQLIELAIVAVKRVFKENGFRFLTKLAEPAFAAGELIQKIVFWR
jgi:hypothetical protein|tara:strand:+ start:1278 stop:1544 length:267 start_codon:yes stop_codon:yes gene_type:complete